MSTLCEDYCLSDYETIIKYLLFFRFKTNPGPDPEFEKRSQQYIKKKNNEGVNRQFINYLIIQLSKKFTGVIQKEFAILKKEFIAENNYNRTQLEKIIIRLRNTKQTLENLMMSSNADLENYIEGVNQSEQNFYEESSHNMMDMSMEKESEIIETIEEINYNNQIYNAEVPQSMMVLTPDEQVKIINYNKNEQYLPSIDLELINKLRKENSISDSLWEFLVHRFNYYDTSINNLRKEIAELKNK